MKIIYLNTWHGRVREAIRKYLQSQIPTTDIFCFQEAYDGMQTLAADVLSDYNVHADYKTAHEEDGFPQATYVHKRLTVTDSGSILHDQPDCGLGVYVSVLADDQEVFVANFHGIALPGDKLDSSSRLTQSRAFIDFFADKERVVIGGDFNLLPETESIQMFAQHGYQDLIQNFNIPTTRNHLAWDRFPESDKQYHSDYVFLSPAMNIQTFTVPDIKVSDHLPLEVVIG